MGHAPSAQPALNEPVANNAAAHSHLEQYEPLDDLYHEACCYHITHGEDDRWLLQPSDAVIAPQDAPGALPKPVVFARKTSVASRSGAALRPDEIEEEIDRLSPELRDLSLKIHQNPELKSHENYAHDELTAFMASHGFSVTKHYKSDVEYPETPKFMTTAWRAEYTHTVNGSHGRTIGVNSEMDALPIPAGQVSHACGHNLIAIAGVAVALGIKKALEAKNIAGRIVLLGTPAEEGGHGKARLIAAGAYKDMDACVMTHPGSGPKHSIVTGSSLAIQAIRVSFKGKPAHAALAPWEGVNAQDAVMLSYNAISMLRQQLRPDLRVHGVVYYEKSALPVNVIPETMSMIWNIRAPTKDDLDHLRERVVACFEGAAKATGCTPTIICKNPLLNLNQNSVLASDFVNNAVEYFGMVHGEAQDVGSFSTDFGNVTYELPAIHPGYAIPTVPNGSNHTPAFAYSAQTPEAHDETMKVSKALALTGFRVIHDDEFFAKVKEAFAPGVTD